MSTNLGYAGLYQYQLRPLLLQPFDLPVLQVLYRQNALQYSYQTIVKTLSHLAAATVAGTKNQYFHNSFTKQIVSCYISILKKLSAYLRGLSDSFLIQNFN